MGKGSANGPARPAGETGSPGPGIPCLSTGLNAISLAVAIAASDNAAELSTATSTAPSTAQQLLALAKQLNLPICDLSDPEACNRFHFTLSYIAGDSPSDVSQGEGKILALSSTQNDFQGSVHIDFLHGKLAHRRQFGGGRGQALAKAIGLKHGANPSVVDATAGLGRDAYILASLGAQVTMIERSPVLAALLADGLKRLDAESGQTDAARIQLQLVHANAIGWLQNQAKQAAHHRPEVVYLDPMYPHRSKSALVKKEMRALRALVGDDEDASQLLQAARQCALKRVVVKRPKGAPLIDDTKPSGNVQSKNTRYDIYPASSQN